MPCKSNSSEPPTPWARTARRPLCRAPAALARLRAQVLLGPITITANEMPAEPIVEQTGLEEFDREAAIAARNAAAIRPYCVEALDRLMMLDDPPVTQEECDDLWEQLESYHQEPEPYGIQGPDDQHINLQLQAYRAYAEVLSRGLPIDFPPRVPVQLALDLEASGLDLEQTGIVAEEAGIHTLEKLRELAPGLLALGFPMNDLAIVAMQPHGCLALEKMTELARDLLRHGLSIADIADAAAEEDGHLILERMLEWMPTLGPHDFPAEIIARIVSRPDSHLNLESMLQWLPDLRELDFSPADIARIASCSEGYWTLAKTAELAPELQDLGFSPVQIAHIAAHPAGYLPCGKPLNRLRDSTRSGSSLPTSSVSRHAPRGISTSRKRSSWPGRFSISATPCRISFALQGRKTGT